jgi:hypothetical protein
MLATQPLDTIPIWVIYPLTVLVLMLVLEGGFWLGKVLKRRFAVRTDAGVGAISAATLALLGFLLAFTVSFAMGVFTERRQAVVNEANAIGTTYLRAGFIEEPYRTESRELLKEYVNIRLAPVDVETLEIAIIRSEEIHDELWKGAEIVVAESPNPATTSYATSLNNVIDIHTERLVVGLAVRVPPALLLGMYVVGLFAMLITGIGGGYIKNRNFIAQLVLVLVLSLVFYLIIDLDRSSEGLLLVPKDAMIALQQTLGS